MGTPYTVYLGRNLYRTFMDAYLVVDQATRKAMEGLLRTWKQSVPESMDTRPVFPANVTGDIENAVNKIRSVAAATQVSRPLPFFFVCVCVCVYVFCSVKIKFNLRKEEDW